MWRLTTLSLSKSGRKRALGVRQHRTTRARHAGSRDTKPFSPAWERNSDPTFAVLSRHLVDSVSVLEVGCGTGRHAMHFAGALPWPSWQCADLAPQLPVIRRWLDGTGLPTYAAALVAKRSL